jgi:hypothetical protein
MDDPSYLDLSQPGDRRERTSFFVLDALLKSRIECGFESNRVRHDEAVNVYLVHLLSSLVRGFWLGQPTAERDIDVFEKVRDSTDPRFKSGVYRANADSLLLSTSLFTHSPYVEVEGQRTFEGSARDRIGRGKAYYHFASMFHERVRGSSPVVAKVLHDLSLDFERYVDVLFHMRGEYFHLYERLKEDQLASLREDLFRSPPADDRTVLLSLRDEFLDAYWIWHQHPTSENRQKLVDAIGRLQAADPAFRCPLPEQ